MAKRVLVTTASASHDLIEASAPDEEHLRETMRSHPLLIPIEDLGLVGPMLVVGRETQLASGRIDLLGVCRSGDIVIAEFKTGTQNSDFRHVLAQLIDYGSDLWRMSVADFDDGVTQRYFRETPSASSLAGRPLSEVAAEHWGLTESELDEFQSRLGAVLKDGDFNFVVVSQNYRSTVVTSADYLNATSRAGRCHLVQMTMLTGGDMTAYSAQIVATTRPVKSGSPSPQAVVDEVDFLNALDGDEYRTSMRDLFASLRSMGIRFGWGSKGTSLRIDNPDRDEPISIGWAFPEGASWLGVRHLSLGYDTATAEKTPSILAALQTYASEIKSIAGGSEVKSKHVDGKMFPPAEVPGVVDAVVEAVERLRDSVNDLM